MFVVVVDESYLALGRRKVKKALKTKSDEQNKTNVRAFEEERLSDIFVFQSV